MAFKKFGKKNSKQENENKNKVTDSNALSEDELSSVSGGWGVWRGHRYATTKEEKEWEKGLDKFSRSFMGGPQLYDSSAQKEYAYDHPCPNGFIHFK